MLAPDRSWARGLLLIALSVVALDCGAVPVRPDPAIQARPHGPAQQAPAMPVPAPGEVLPVLKSPLSALQVTSGFGWRLSPTRGKRLHHDGIDLAAPRGAQVFAARDGVVTGLGRMHGYGRYVRIAHPGQIETLYAHLQSFARSLRAGAAVRAGQAIGAVGSSGSSTGPHLHFQVFRAGRLLDPGSCLPRQAVALRGR